VHEAIPDVASLPANVTVTGALYQPLAFGLRSALEPVTVGASLSILNWRWRLAVMGPLVAEQSSVELARKVLTAGQFGRSRRSPDLHGDVADLHPLLPAVPTSRWA
jgi:hypothetical protein